jgi:RHS repeat-associated protein
MFMDSKGITSITYNYLNLPSVIIWSNGNKIELSYDAAGMKLSKKVSVGTTEQYTQHYLGGIEYTGTGSTRKLEAIYFADGRVYNTNVTTTSSTVALRYEYAIRDHLGNTRLMFADLDASNTISLNEVLQENHYYPFGMNMEGAWMNDATSKDNKFQYNGKELNEDFGLGWSDYGKRWYDAALGRWGQVDPRTTEYIDLSGYHFSGNNPIIYHDIDGARFYFAPGAGGDKDGWDYTSRWQFYATKNGIGGFVPINVTRGQMLDVEFTSLNRMTPFDEYVTSGYAGFRYHSTIDRKERSVPPTVQESVKLIEKDLKDNPLQKGEQLNLTGYSYGSVLFAHTALQLADKGVVIDNLILVGSPIPSDSKLFEVLKSHENIKNVIRYDIAGDLLSDPQSIKDYLFGGAQNSNPNTGPHFNLARPDENTNRNLQVIMEWLRLQGVK